MRILALVTARGGSKRLPGKNLKILGGKPLVIWSVEATRDVPGIVDTLVSTDSAEIAEVSQAAGALVPWLRPPELATDTASSADVAIHAMDWYEREKGAVDGLLLLQPTSPFRTRAAILRGIEMFASNQRRPVVGVSPAASHPFWCFRVDGSTMRPFVEGQDGHLRSQDLPPAYTLNGAFYLIAPQTLRADRSFYSDNMVPLIMDAPHEHLDIDTPADWMAAERAVEDR